MALFELKDFIKIGVPDDPIATSWQVAADPDFEDIIAESLFDKENIFQWRVAPIKEDGSFYEEDDIVYARVKLHFKNTDSDWFYMYPDKSSVTLIKMNFGDPKDAVSKLVGLQTKNVEGKFTNDNIDEYNVDLELRRYRDEEYRTDYPIEEKDYNG